MVQSSEERLGNDVANSLDRAQSVLTIADEVIE